MPVPSVLILGCGYTGSRVAQRLKARHVEVRTTRSSDLDVTSAAGLDRLTSLVTPGCIVLHSIPTLPNGADRGLLKALGGQPKRVVYLSTTGVYGSAQVVDEHSLVQPSGPRQQARVETEQAVQQGPWQSLILRPAAIYGPARGVHVALAQGRYTLLGDGSNFVSRIHVDDLAMIAERALHAGVTGAYPVADQHPCPAREIAEYCAHLLNLPRPVGAPPDEVPESRRANRKVDGSAICRELGLTLRYPSYLQGIPAALAADSATIEKAR